MQSDQHTHSDDGYGVNQSKGGQTTNSAGAGIKKQCDQRHTPTGGGGHPDNNGNCGTGGRDHRSSGHEKEKDNQGKPKGKEDGPRQETGSETDTKCINNPGYRNTKTTKLNQLSQNKVPVISG